ncbi:hypothetical protein KIN20_034466 [Parelaphostrongylus tenuis]|uniref:Uncharacterized protein n=1 Tax=Parelaphostrongylus tenuis TaxID=148309 RepID=A0AAD5RAD6_PARTN|nr:hypothetical protein KIN20_034466 [Parelaphostrongylus tenuis]
MAGRTVINAIVRHTRTTKPIKKERIHLESEKLPADVMAELHGTQKMRQERGASVQREMTQSCHPDMAQWKTAESDSRYDRSASATPFRASSVGPTMRRLEQVVRRLDDTSDNEAQYVFRARPSDYTMGNAVFTSVDEAEKMRDGINRMSSYESRPITPAHSVVSGRFTPYGHENYAPSSYKSDENGVRRRARTVDPIVGRESMPRTTSSFYANSPVASHTVRRTPVAFDRGPHFAYDRGGVTQGSVSGYANRWPPASNATGAEVVKDEWVKDILRENENGLVTTMCRRVMERKTEDKWKWLDDQGHLLDEKNQRTWKHWSRTVECLPSGDTLFQDVSRQYNNNYVVESIVRNY